MKIADILTQPWGTTIDVVAGKVIALYPVKGGPGFSLQNAKLADENGRVIDVMFSSFPKYWDIATYRNGYAEIRGVPGAPLVWKEQFKAGESLKKAKLEVTVVEKDGTTFTPLVKMLTPSQAAAVGAGTGGMQLDLGQPSTPQPAPESSAPLAPQIQFPNSGVPAAGSKRQGNAAVVDELRRMILLHRMVVDQLSGEELPDNVTMESAVSLVYVQATREGLHHKLDAIETAEHAAEPARPNLAKFAEMIKGKEERAESFLRLVHILKPEQSWRDMDEVAAERAVQETPNLLKLIAS